MKYSKIPKEVTDSIHERFEKAVDVDKQFNTCNEFARKEELLSKELDEHIRQSSRLISETGTEEGIEEINGKQESLERRLSITRSFLDKEERTLASLRQQEGVCTMAVRDTLNEALDRLTRKTRQGRGPLFWETWEILQRARNEAQAEKVLSKLNEAFAGAPSGLMTVFR